jgi:hypothetical protein
VRFLVAGVVLLGLFMLAETKVRSPILPLTMFCRC